MSERLLLQIHDFLLEGRDEEKSHVILEIAKPVPEELKTHGSFIVLAELSGATPKTIQMVRAWVEFAIDAYYSTVPSNLEQHFEDLLQRLNTQSALYLKQHPEVQLDMAIVGVRHTEVFLAFHGAPSVLLLYRKQEAWQYMNLVEQDGPAAALFSNVMTGTLRVGDRLCIASPRTIEFFPADRITKLCETKSTPEVSDHMARILSDLGSDVSFGCCWAEIEKTVLPEPVQEIAEVTTELKQKQSVRSMKDLLHQTKSTESLLSPPVLTIQKDKIVTHTLQALQRGAGITGRTTVSALRATYAAVNQNRKPFARVCASLWSAAKTYFTSGSDDKQRTTRMLAISGIAVCVVGGIIFAYKIHQSQIAKDVAAIAAIRADIQAADEAYQYQNSDHAVSQIQLAQTAFDALPRSAQANQNAAGLATDLAAEEQKIFQIYPATFTELATNISGAQLVLMHSTPALMQQNGTVSVLKNNALQNVATAPSGSQTLLYDDTSDRLIAIGPNFALQAISTKAGTATTVNVARVNGNTQINAAVLYGGHLYVFDDTAHALYKYASAGTGFGSGEVWLKDTSKPTGGVALQADTSLWLLTNNGLLKFTAGKAQPFAFGSVTPALTTANAFTLGPSSDLLYVLDRAHNRVVELGRDGSFNKQYQFPAGQNLSQISIDEKETAAFGITDDGRLVKFALAK